MAFVVKDRFTGEPVSFAVTRTQRGGRYVGGQADYDGRVTFTFMPGERIELQMVGYATGNTSTEEVLVRGGVAYMDAATATLPPVVVERERPKSGAGVLALLLLLLLARS